MAVLANAKHEAVALAYLADPKKIGWRAYRKVYPKASRPAAKAAISRLLRNANFAARLAELKDAAAGPAVMDLQEVLAELSKLGRSNMQHFVSVAGDDTAEVIRSLHDLPAEHAAAIQELIVETYVEGAGENARDVKRVKIKLHPKTTALSELRSHHEPKRHEVTGKDGGPVLVKEDISPLEAARRIAFAIELAAREAAKKEKP